MTLRVRPQATSMANILSERSESKGVARTSRGIRGRRPGSALTRALLALSVLIGAAPIVFAQDPAPAQPGETQAPPVTAGWRDGFYVQSEKGDFKLQIGALLQVDGRFAPGDNTAVLNDTFVFRRLRPYLRGRIARRVEFFVNPDFAGGTLVVQDAYFDTIFSPAFRIRLGKGKTPFGLERLHAAANLLFIERAFPTLVAPNRDIGVQVLGDIASGALSYQAGVFNGVADGLSGDLDTNDGKDLAGRLVVRPFQSHAASRLHGLGVAIAGTTGPQTGATALPAFRTSVLQSYFSYSGSIADGTRTRYSPQAFYYYKTFGAFGEYAHSQMPVRKGPFRGDVAHDAWQVAGSFVLTGETASDGSTTLRPRTNFDFGNGHYGALQIAARYHVLTIDRAALALDFAAAGSSRKAEAWTLGLNWYLTPNVKYVCNFERTIFDDNASGSRDPENALAFRAQLNF